MLREAREELGAGLDLVAGDLHAAALVRYSDSREQDAPVLVFTAKSRLTLAEVMFGLRYAHPTDGLGELGAHVLAVLVRPQDLGAVVAFLLDEHAHGTLTVPGLVCALLCLAPGAGHDRRAAPASAPCPAEVLRLAVDVPGY